MSQTVPTAITALPTAPSTSDPTTFSARADALIAALALFVSQNNALGVVNYDNTVDAYNSALAAFASQLAAAASASSAAASVGVSVWVSGTTYSTGDQRFSPITFLTYRRKTNGDGTTDPSLDTTNWITVIPAAPFAGFDMNYTLYGCL